MSDKCRYTIDDIIIRPAVLLHQHTDATPHECNQLYTLINAAFRGRTIQRNGARTVVLAQLNEQHIFKDLSERIDMNEIEALQNSSTCVVLVAIVQYNSKRYTESADHTMVHDGILVGCVRCEHLIANDSTNDNDKRNKYRTSNGTSFELGLFSVDPLYSGVGIGSLLFNYAEQYGIKQYNCTTALIWILSNRPDLRALYIKYGFTMIEKHASELKPPSTDLIDSNTQLYFDVMQRIFHID